MGKQNPRLSSTSTSTARGGGQNIDPAPGAGQSLGQHPPWNKFLKKLGDSNRGKGTRGDCTQVEQYAVRAALVTYILRLVGMERIGTCSSELVRAHTQTRETRLWSSPKIPPCEYDCEWW